MPVSCGWYRTVAHGQPQLNRAAQVIRRDGKCSSAPLQGAPVPRDGRGTGAPRFAVAIRRWRYDCFQEPGHGSRYRRLVGRRGRRATPGRADLIRDQAWDPPALVSCRVLGIPEEDVARVKAGAGSRLLLMWRRPNEDEQIRLAQGMAAFWRYAETLVASRAAQPRDDFTSDLLLAREGDLPALITR
jgi:hypothetical protein